MKASYVCADGVVAEAEHTHVPQDRGARVFERRSYELLRCLLVLQDVTGINNGGRIDRDVAFVDVLNDAFFVDHEGGPIAEALFLVEDTIIFDDGAFEIAE